MDQFSFFLPIRGENIEVLINLRKIPFRELCLWSDVLYMIVFSFLLLAFAIVCIGLYKRAELQKTGLAKAVIGVVGAVFLLLPLLQFCAAVGYFYFSSVLKEGSSYFIPITIRPYLAVMEVFLILVYVFAKGQAVVCREEMQHEKKRGRNIEWLLLLFLAAVTLIEAGKTIEVQRSGLEKVSIEKTEPAASADGAAADVSIIDLNVSKEETYEESAIIEEAKKAFKAGKTVVFLGTEESINVRDLCDILEMKNPVEAEVLEEAEKLTGVIFYQDRDGRQTVELYFDDSKSPEERKENLIKKAETADNSVICSTNVVWQVKDGYALRTSNAAKDNDSSAVVKVTKNAPEGELTYAAVGRCISGGADDSTWNMDGVVTAVPKDDYRMDQIRIAEKACAAEDESFIRFEPNAFVGDLHVGLSCSVSGNMADSDLKWSMLIQDNNIAKQLLSVVNLVCMANKKGAVNWTASAQVLVKNGSLFGKCVDVPKVQLGFADK